MMTGEAAGVAAGLAVEDKKTMAEVDVKELQKRLRKCNINIPE